MSIISEWKEARERRRRAVLYVSRLSDTDTYADADWFIGISPFEANTVRRELILASRALALIVAGRDSLDDNTAADVSRLLEEKAREGEKSDPQASLTWQDRWLSYSSAMAKRGVSDPPARRLGKVLLITIGVVSPSAEELDRASAWIVGRRRVLNEALREAYGSVSLPENVRPSAVGKM